MFTLLLQHHYHMRKLWYGMEGHTRGNCTSVVQINSCPCFNRGIALVLFFNAKIFRLLTIYDLGCNPIQNSMTVIPFMSSIRYGAYQTVNQ
jgi:hypothetical protein